MVGRGGGWGGVGGVYRREEQSRVGGAYRGWGVGGRGRGQG